MRSEYLLAAHANFDLVNSDFESMSFHYLAHFLWSIGVSCDASHEVPITTSNLLGVGKIPWTGNIAGVDGIANDNIQPVLCRSSTEAPMKVKVPFFSPSQ